MAPLHTDALIATACRDPPARCGAFADERRVAADDERARPWSRGSLRAFVNWRSNG